MREIRPIQLMDLLRYEYDIRQPAIIREILIEIVNQL